MDDPRAPRRRARRTAVALAATGAALVAAGAAAGPAAAARHAPCPTTGTTLARTSAPNLRVYRQGTALKACLRRPGTRRTVRTLGSWTAGARVAAGAGTVAWTTPRPATGGPVDGLTTEDVRSGRRWLRTVRAVPAASLTAPADDDRVLALVTDARATAWVTARGVVAAALRALPEDPATLYGAGLPGTEPFHVGRRFALGDAGPAAAPAVARDLRLAVGGDGDECGGVDDYQVRIPAFADRPETIFRYASVSWARTTGPCG